MQIIQIIQVIQIRGTYSKEDQIVLVKIGKHKGYCVYRKSYLLWSPVVPTCPETSESPGGNRSLQGAQRCRAFEPSQQEPCKPALSPYLNGPPPPSPRKPALTQHMPCSRRGLGSTNRLKGGNIAHRTDQRNSSTTRFLILSFFKDSP